MAPAGTITFGDLETQQHTPTLVRLNFQEADIRQAFPESPHTDPSLDPLIVDLDGTLVRSNMLFEGALAYIRSAPFAIFHILLWLVRGRAHLKQQLARQALVDVGILPLNADMVAYASGEKARGRKLFLATAADQDIAQAVAQRCGIFDGVIASDGTLNLKGRHKGAALQRMFPRGFAYAGDSHADHQVWSLSSEAIIVGQAGWARRTAQRLRQPHTVFETASQIPALIRSARPHQWAKNVLIFVPIILGGVAADPVTLLKVGMSFAALCIVASSTYLLNDLWDVQDDRRHWSKNKRPIASGQLPIATAAIAVAVGLSAGLTLGVLVSPKVGAALFVYTAITLAYSFGLKRVPVVDVAILAGLFTVRLVIGILAAQIAFSSWLLVFSMFLFSSLCFAKRYVEVDRSAARSQSIVSSRGYESGDINLLLNLGTGTGVAAITVLVLYIMFDAFRYTFYGNTMWLWAFPIILFLWLSRVWLMAIRGKLDDDPVAFAVHDRTSICLGGAMFFSFLLAWSGAFA